MHIGNRLSRTLPHKLSCLHRDRWNKESVYITKNNNIIAKYNFNSKFFNNFDSDLFWFKRFEVVICLRWSYFTEWVYLNSFLVKKNTTKVK